MSKELIKLQENNGRKAVNVKELHSFLEIKKHLTQWLKPYTKEDNIYGFVENVDFAWIDGEVNPTNGIPIKECVVTIDMAKELSMLSKSKKGKQARQYFIDCEKQLQQVSQFKLPHTYKEALLQLVEQVEKNEQLEENNKILNKENDLLSEDILRWANRPLINALVRAYSGRYNTIDKFAKAWKDFKREILYKHSINLNSRITNYLNTTGKRTKPKTLDMLHNEEIPQAVSTIVALCRENDIDISETIKKFSEEHKN